MPKIPLHLIDATNRLRSADADQVAAIAASMKEIGLLNPIAVWPRKIIPDHIAVDGYGLICGLHRLEAARSLGWTEIEATISDLPDLQRQLAECDENLLGTKLSPAERALFTRRRKEIYEALHPETRHEAFKGNQHTGSRQIDDNHADRFTADTAKRTGHSEATVQREARRGERVAETVMAQIKGTDLDKGVVLDELAAAPKEQQLLKLREIAERRAAAALREKEANEARRENKVTDSIVKDRRVEAVVEFLAARLDVDELHRFGELTAGICEVLSRACMREAA